jgi:hypothetical protein
VVGNAQQGDSKLPPPNLMTLVETEYQQEIGINICSRSHYLCIAFFAAAKIIW